MKSPLKVTQGAAGSSAWLVLDYLQRPFSVGLFGSLDFNGVGTYKAQYTPDNPFLLTPCSIARAATVATATFAAAHGLAVGDSIRIINSGDPNLDGLYDVATVPTATTLTYAVANTGLAASAGDTKAVLLRVYDHATFTGKTARASDSQLFPVWAVRLNITAYTSGSITLEVVQGLGRG